MGGELAKVDETEHGLTAVEPGSFVINLADARWRGYELAGHWTDFEPPEGFEHYGIGVHVLQPGQPNGKYHSENVQEDFLVLSGECILLVEGEERPLKAWDFVHCPPWTEHVFVGAGDGPCAIVGVGARNAGEGLRYPVSDVALKHSAGVTEEATSGKVAYAGVPETTKAPYSEGLPEY
jgi:uncharacterized cupin superfamily protein